MKHLLKPILALAAALALTGIISTFAQEPDIFVPPPLLTAADRAIDPAAFLIPRERLSNQESHPLRFLGEPMDETWPRRRALRGAVPYFTIAAQAQGIDARDEAPGTVVRGCIVEGARVLEEENLQQAMIDWSSTRTLENLERCVFSTSAILRDAAAIADWLNLNGFIVTRIDQSEDFMRLHGATGRGTLIDGGMMAEDISLELGFLDRLFVHSLSVSILLDRQDSPVKASAALTRK